MKKRSQFETAAPDNDVETPGRRTLKVKNLLADFGTYHHTTARDSEKIRQNVKVLFAKTFADLPFSRGGEIEILDIGCGLGFLSCLCAEHYSNAKITGIDTFEDASLKNSSLKMAKKNAEILGFSKRISFRKMDIFQLDLRKGKFDLFVSNLVFHNLGKTRFDAYERVARWMKPNSYLVLGDVFFDYKKDHLRLKSLFGNVQVKSRPRMGGGIYRILVISNYRKN
jgi:2-polyprenyl-3-methyl-5-hydroxy-6-metoxy-1,4-benzoquinol methylase